MIRIHRENHPPPDVLVTKCREAVDKLISVFNQGETKFKFKKDVYGGEEVKNVLITMQNKKCCFCEGTLLDTSPGDVEHFRPKAAILLNNKLTPPGYFWLAYDWKNLLLSCENCNRREKKNKFPLLDESKRVKPPDPDIGQEKPLFIDPSSEDPEEFISFVKWMPFAIDKNPRGDATIKELGLERKPLDDEREGYFVDVLEDNLNDLLNAIMSLDMAKELGRVREIESNRKRIGEIKEKMEKHTNEKSKYTSMARAFYRHEFLRSDVRKSIKALKHDIPEVKSLHTWMNTFLKKKDRLKP